MVASIDVLSSTVGGLDLGDDAFGDKTTLIPKVKLLLELG